MIDFEIVLHVSYLRTIILRRFFALGGTIFFLRSITMLVTSLSVRYSSMNESLLPPG